MSVRTKEHDYVYTLTYVNEHGQTFVATVKPWGNNNWQFTVGRRQDWSTSLRAAKREASALLVHSSGWSRLPPPRPKFPRFKRTEIRV